MTDIYLIAKKGIERYLINKLYRFFNSQLSYMKVLLLSLQRNLDTIGLKFIHYYLLKNGHQSFIFYLPNFNPDDISQRQNIKKFVEELNPSLVGISLMSNEYYNACHLTKFLKTFIGQTPIVWGGIHPTIAPEDCLGEADYICVGEGETTILEIANAIERNENIKNINNICYYENGLLKQNQLRPLLENLDQVPYYEHIPQNSFILVGKKISPLNKKIFKKYARYLGKIYSVMATRGCPFSCTYCCNNFISQLYGFNKIRRRSVESVISELQKNLQDNPEIEYINFQDDCFLACSDEYLISFCKIYKEKVGRPFIIRAIPIYITKEKIRALKDAGLAWISLGLQSGSDRTCKEIYNRKSLKSDFLRAAKIIKDFNIAAFYDVILDNPFENEEDHLETIDTLIKTPKPFYTQFFSLVFYRGTQIYEKAKLDYPQLTEDYLKRDFLVPRANVINNLIRLAAFVDGKIMEKIVSLFERQPNSLRFKFYLKSLNILNLFIFQPLTFFRVIKLSQRGSYLKTFSVLPIYFKEGIMRYVNQLKGEK